MTERRALLEAMEQQSISIAKAGLVCSLPARATVIAAANPVGGHYNQSKSVGENLKMNSALLSRFDLVFILLDKPDVAMDAHISAHILKIHGSESRRAGRAHETKPIVGDRADGQNMDDSAGIEERLTIEGHFDPIPPNLLRKYVSYARKYCHPRLSPEAAGVLQHFYLDLREKVHQEHYFTCLVSIIRQYSNHNASIGKYDQTE